MFCALLLMYNIHYYRWVRKWILDDFDVTLLHFYLKCTYSRFNFAYDTHNCYVSQYIVIVMVRSIHGIQHFFLSKNNIYLYTFVWGDVTMQQRKQIPNTYLTTPTTWYSWIMEFIISSFYVSAFIQMHCKSIRYIYTSHEAEIKLYSWYEQRQNRRATR